jgi:1-acyl-sn-glycerol-3-phosphate acyltransferase
MISACAGITVSIKGAENMAPGQSYIITPNHQSHMDILAYLQKLPHPFRWVGKRSLLSIPFFGWALAATGALGIDRSKKEEAVRILRDSYSKLEGGWSVLIYPEGTRSRDGGLGDFKKGAFMMAVQSGAPILPVTANGAFNILPRGTLALTPGHIEIIVGEPIPVDGLTEKDVPALMEKTRAVIERNLKPPTA